MGAIFDADGNVVDRDALQSVGVRPAGFRKAHVVEDKAAGTKTVGLIHEDDGGIAATQTHHADDSISANVYARAVEAGLSS